MTTGSAPFGGLLASWERSLRARGRSPRTIDSYLESARLLADYLPPGTELGEVDTAAVESFIVHLLDTRSASTARVRYASLKQLFKWALTEDEISADPMANMSPPAQPTKEVPVLSDDELRRLLESAKGPAFGDRRDAAIMWVLVSTGIRAGELVGMHLGDVDLDRGTLTVTGKGNRERTVAVGDKTVVALDRYERARRKHSRAAATDAYWLGRYGPLTDSGLRQLIRRRGEDVGIPDLHPHRFRHTFAHRWLSAGGSEQGLQTSAGWRSPQMLQRYGASAKAERAREEAGRLGLEPEL